MKAVLPGTHTMGGKMCSKHRKVTLALFDAEEVTLSGRVFAMEARGPEQESYHPCSLK